MAPGRGLRPWSGPGALLRHRGAGPLHLDVVLATGARCLTLRLDARTWSVQAPHRRRYLAYGGPVPPGPDGRPRGVAVRLWRGPARLAPTAAGWWRLDLGAWCCRLCPGGRLVLAG